MSKWGIVMTFYKNRSGFSLMEMVMVMGISSGLMLAISATMQLTSKTSMKAQQTGDQTSVVAQVNQALSAGQCSFTNDSSGTPALNLESTPGTISPGPLTNPAANTTTIRIPYTSFASKGIVTISDATYSASLIAVSYSGPGATGNFSYLGNIIVTTTTKMGTGSSATTKTVTSAPMLIRFNVDTSKNLVSCGAQAP